MTHRDELPKDSTSAHDNDEQLLTEDQLAEWPECPHSKNTLRQMRYIGNGPPYYKIGRFIRYDRNEYRAWARSRRYRSTSEETANARTS